MPATSKPSSNWHALQKTLPVKSKAKRHSSHEPSTKRRKLDDGNSAASTSTYTQEFQSKYPPKPANLVSEDDMKNGESLSRLRRMIRGEIPPEEFNDQQRLPGKYLALDCEMVGVGIEGSESSLARVSLVNYYGVTQLDVFVRQRERVVDYRTQWSGVRERDMFNAIPFDDVQKQVADLLKDRILVGHAVTNDLKALLLKHPRPQTRDTQFYAGKYKVVKSKYIALRNLVKQELDLQIQEGEHSSVTDARATMAVFRLHRKEWEKDARPMTGKRKATAELNEADSDDNSPRAKPPKKTMDGQGRKGVSSGLSTIVHRKTTTPAKKWWKELLPPASTTNVKGKVKV